MPHADHKLHAGIYSTNLLDQPSMEAGATHLPSFWVDNIYCIILLFFCYVSNSSIDSTI